MEVFNCNGRLLDLSTPVVMGIMNLTPDSFYAHSRIDSVDEALRKADEMIGNGATIIDIGAMSSRPGSDFISESEEIKRLIPTLQKLRKSYPETFFSIDTFRAGVAKSAIEEGADIINDISSASLDDNMLEIIADYNIPYIFMHMNGVPKTMQENPQYEDVTADILKFSLNKLRYFRSVGMEQLIFDPGFGFGKSIDDNYKLLKELEVFGIIEIPVLIGISRKSMMYKYLNISPEESLNATSALHMIALQKGAKILRVHDVKEAMEVIKLNTKLQN